MKASAIKKLLWLGAGELQKPYIDFDLFSNIILVEARSEASKSVSLRNRNNIQLINKVLTLGKEKQVFFQHSFANFSSIKKPTQLTNIFPGNSALFQRDVESITLDEVLEVANLQNNSNTLVIDLPCLAADIVEKLKANNQLDYFDVIYLYCGKDALYEGAATASQLVEILEKEAYSLEHIANDDPDIPLLRFKYSADKERILELESRVAFLTGENRKLKSALGEQTSLLQVEEKLLAILDKQRSESVEIANALGQHVTKCSRAIEEACQSSIELQKLSGIKHSLLPHSPYTMSPGNLLQLASLVQKERFDLIIEFGSGISTLVTAGAAKAQCKIVSFEQSYTIMGTTYDLLAENYLQENVEICYTPLITSEYRLNELSSGTFYDCKEKLTELSHGYADKTLNILVVVDGPDVDGNDQNIRYASFPLLLDCFNGHTLTFFLDDSMRAGEQAVLTGWQEEAARRKIQIECENIHTGRGVAKVKISQ